MKEVDANIEEEGGEVRVLRGCLGFLSINSFQDCVLCDGKTMNVCHLLLPSGRPCQHDRQKPSMVEGVVHTFCIRWCSPTVCNQSTKSKPQANSQDEG